jgi:hypothetical protein
MNLEVGYVNVDGIQTAKFSDFKKAGNFSNSRDTTCGS